MSNAVNNSSNFSHLLAEGVSYLEAERLYLEGRKAQLAHLPVLTCDEIHLVLPTPKKGRRL